MGAVTFIDSAFAKDAHTAFLAAREQAAWEHGHGGYTGTIAEKPGFVLIPRPPRVKASDVLDALAAARRAEAMIDKSHPGFDKWWKRDPFAEQSWKRLVGWYGESNARRYVGLYDSKWDECIAVEGSDAETAAHKKRNGIGVTIAYRKDGTKDVTTRRVQGRVFFFGGWASC